MIDLVVEADRLRRRGRRRNRLGQGLDPYRRRRQRRRRPTRQQSRARGRRPRHRRSRHTERPPQRGRPLPRRNDEGVIRKTVTGIVTITIVVMVVVGVIRRGARRSHRRRRRWSPVRRRVDEIDVIIGTRGVVTIVVVVVAMRGDIGVRVAIGIGIEKVVIERRMFRVVDTEPVILDPKDDTDLRDLTAAKEADNRRKQTSWSRALAAVTTKPETVVDQDHHRYQLARPHHGQPRAYRRQDRLDRHHGRRQTRR